MKQEEKDLYLQNGRNRDEERRNNMNPEEREAYLQNMRNRVQQQRNAIKEDQTLGFHIGDMNVICRYCGALRFSREILNCCHKGKVLIPALEENPGNLKQLFDINNHEGSNFRNNIRRKYNSAFASASFGANIKPPPGPGPYCFRLQGQIYHYTSNLHPNETK
ncbi:uncharacterized protein LOC106877253 [Octopus bimaculoides]|uniref:uncharacterized protein LOC106877253 n=1 Tax=Octopus bimaculoides TaxID=37653 RepID=UPI00071DA0FC|nr:uncharacterized protein LOC106877253 [Octopus bimaculoides]|eukprot:XP_014781602.1 PREDICTED: uncharacterized protein LOC106877253 [Octopus bimaculoides]